MLPASSVKFASDKISTPLQRWFFVRRQPLSLPRLLPTTTNPYQEHGAMFYCRYCNQQLLNAQDRDTHVNENRASPPADARTSHRKENHSSAAVKDLARGQCDNMVVHDKERFNLRNYLNHQKSPETRAHVLHQRSASGSRFQPSTPKVRVSDQPPPGNTTSAKLEGFCLSCSYFHRYPLGDLRHHLIQHIEQGDLISCNECFDFIPNPADLDKHAVCFEREAKRFIAYTANGSCTFRLCESCGFCASGYHQLSRHKGWCHKELACRFCKEMEVGFVGIRRHTCLALNGRSTSKGQSANLASVIAREANAMDLELLDSTEEITIKDGQNESAVSTSTRSTNGEAAAQKMSTLAQSKKGQEQLRQRKTSSSEDDDEPAPKKAISNLLKAPKPRQNVFAAGANGSKESTSPTPRSAPKRKTMEEMHNAADMEYVCTLCDQLTSAYQSEIICHLETIHKTRHDICPDFCQLREIPQPAMDEEEEDQRSNMASIGVQPKKKCLECKLWSKKVQSLENVLAKVAKQIGEAKKQLEEEENE